MLRGGPHHVAYCRTRCSEYPICERSSHDRAARGSAVARGPDGTIDARREPDEVAPGAHVVVLRRVRAGAAGRVPGVRPDVPLSLQLLLRGCRATASAA